MYGGSSFNFLKDLYTFFHNDCTNLYSHQHHWVGGSSLFSASTLTFVIYCRFDNCHLTDMKRCLTVVSVCVSMLISRVEHLHTRVGRLNVFFEETSVQVVCPFFSQVVSAFRAKLYEFFTYHTFQLLTSHWTYGGPASSPVYWSVFSFYRQLPFLCRSFFVCCCTVCLLLLLLPLSEETGPNKYC